MSGSIPPFPVGPGSSPARPFGFFGGKDKNFKPQQFANTGYANLLRNGSLISASQGGTARPDGWDFTGNGTLQKVNAVYFIGGYCYKILKTNSDAAADHFYQEVYEQFASYATSNIFTFSARLKCNLADHACLFYYDGSNYYYGPFHSGGDEWEEHWMQISLDSSATDFWVGIYCENNAPLIGQTYTYVDAAMLVFGSVPTLFTEHPSDRSVICQDWDIDGTYKRIRGASRQIPFKATSSQYGTTTGGAVSEVIATVPLNYGCRQIQHVDANLYSFPSRQERHQVWTNNYTTTGFDLVLGRVDGSNITASQAWTVTGAIYCISWDDRGEQWK